MQRETQGAIDPLDQIGVNRLSIVALSKSQRAIKRGGEIEFQKVDVGVDQDGDVAAQCVLSNGPAPAVVATLRSRDSMAYWRPHRIDCWCTFCSPRAIRMMPKSSRS